MGFPLQKCSGSPKAVLIDSDKSSAAMKCCNYPAGVADGGGSAVVAVESLSPA